MDWLDQVTFPTEAKFADPEFARSVYQSVIRRTLDAGVNSTLPASAGIDTISFLDNHLLLLWNPIPGRYQDTR